MPEAALLFGLLLGGAAAFLAWRRIRLRAQSRRRLEDDLAAEDAPLDDFDADEPAPSILRRWGWVGWLAAAAFFAAAYFGFGWGPWLSPAGALVVGLLSSRLEAFLAERREFQLEQQLGHALDLLTSSIQAGAALSSALESTVRELRPPMRDLLEELTARIRLGDPPPAALAVFMQRAPLESVRLFGATLSVHWETGGSLGPTLASVSRTIRDRVELARRMQATTMQTRLTVVVVLGSVYIVSLLMWRNDPSRMEGFMRSTFGQGAVAAALVLQAAGIVWVGAIAKPRF